MMSLQISLEKSCGNEINKEKMNLSTMNSEISFPSFRLIELLNQINLIK